MVLWEPPRQSRGIGSGHFALGAWRSIAARPAGAASAAVRTAFPSLLGSEPLSLRPFYAVCSGARGSRSLASTFAVTTLLSSLGLLLPQPTSAAYLVERVETTPSARFINGDECAPATVAVPLKRGAFAIRVLDGPRPGETLFGRDTDQQVGVVTGVRVRPRQRAVFGTRPRCRVVVAPTMESRTTTRTETRCLDLPSTTRGPARCTSSLSPIEGASGCGSLVAQRRGSPLWRSVAGSAMHTTWQKATQDAGGRGVTAPPVPSPSSKATSIGSGASE